MTTTAEDVGLYDLGIILWRGRLVLAGACVLALLVAAVHWLVAPRVYRAEVLLEVREADSASLTGLAALGGFAELAGMPIAQGRDKAVAIATVRSRALVEGFLDERKVLPKLFAAQWDSEAGRWEDDDDAPTLWDAYNKFTRHNLQVSEDRKTGLVTVAVEWTNPDEARDWVAEIVRRANARLKAEAVSEGEKNLQYLQEQSKIVGQVELRQALFGLVETELKKLMVAKGNDEFAFKTIDPAVAPKLPVRPNAVLIGVMYLLAGLLISTLYVLWRSVATRRMN